MGHSELHLHLRLLMYSGKWNLQGRRRHSHCHFQLHCTLAWLSATPSLAQIYKDSTRNMGSLATLPTPLKDLTYPFPNLKDFTLDDNVSERDIPLDNGRHSPSPKVAFGALEVLPLELLHQILCLVDLRSLTDIRRVNQRAMQVIDSIAPYQFIIQHGSTPLRCILATQTGSLVSCRDLFRTLTTARCGNCNDFAGYIYILTCKRVCFLCCSEDIKYLPVSTPEMKRRYGLSRNMAIDLPCIKTLPGYYSPNQRKCRARMTLFDHESIRRAAESYHGSAAAMRQHADDLLASRLDAYQARVRDTTRNEDDPTPRRPPLAAMFDGKSSNPRRFMSVVRAPHLDLATNTEDWGFHCIGCRTPQTAPRLHWRRKYSKETFAAHIKECGQIDLERHCHLTDTSGSE